MKFKKQLFQHKINSKHKTNWTFSWMLRGNVVDYFNDVSDLVMIEKKTIL